MESKETNSVLSLFSSDNQPIIHQRRIKSASLLLDKISSEYFSDKNELKGENIIDMPNIECKENPDVPIVKVIEKGNLLLNSNSYGFKGRSPYVSNTNTRPKVTNSNTNNNNNNSKMNSNQKIINGFIFTELKDKVFEYRCSVCNFVAHANGELHKHLTMHKHFILPKKNKKNKSKNYHKQENRLNQTFMFSMNKPKKYFEKKIVCKHCSKRFESNYALNSHLNAHKYKCDVCYKLFNNREDLLEHKHNMEDKCNYNSPSKKKSNKYYKEPKNKIEIDDWEEVSSNKKEKIKEKNNELEESYAFIEDNDENIDFNKMIKINDGI
jgi:hypothetical protein